MISNSVVESASYASFVASYTSFVASYVIVVTDACLRLLASGEAPISTYGIVINMVVGGEVVTLNNIEEGTGLLIAEMPINISEIL
ncbi:hypothetical protein QQ045_017959 [Rhodiola kirilowii]